MNPAHLTLAAVAALAAAGAVQKRGSRNATNSDAFRRWFGDSQVVDEQGAPLVVYRGTVRQITEDYTPTGGLEVPRAIFFSDNVDVAEPYRYEREFGEFITSRYDEASDEYVEIEPGGLINAYLSIKNPLILEGPDAQFFTDDAARQSRMVDEARAKGHDGIIARNVVEDQEPGTTYVVFSPTQIKSATGNRGTFSPTDPRISYNRRAP